MTNGFIGHFLPRLKLPQLTVQVLLGDSGEKNKEALINGLNNPD
jgi:hypothetical protein